MKVPARLAQPQRRPVLHLPKHWPWAQRWLAIWTAVFGQAHRTPRSRLTPRPPPRRHDRRTNRGNAGQTSGILMPTPSDTTRNRITPDPSATPRIEAKARPKAFNVKTGRRAAGLTALLLGALLVGTGCGGPDPFTTTDGQSPSSRTPRVVSESARTLANLATITARPSPPGYDRSCTAGHECVFGPAWTDDVTTEYGHNGCSTRDDVLRIQLRNVLTKAGTNGCVVTAGDLDDPYTGAQIHYTKTGGANVAVDHVVALAVGWDLGAYQWSLPQRRNFANDPRNLLATTAGANTAKGDRTPAQWRPATAAGRCLYAQRYIDVSAAYALPVTTSDRAALLENLGECSGEPSPRS